MMGHRGLAAATVLILSAGLAGWAPGAAADGGRPLLVTVDDLPMGPTRPHQDPAERRRITEGLLAAMAKHRIKAVGLVTWSHVLSDADLDLLSLWLKAGHELGNHSVMHLDYTETDSRTFIKDTELARARLERFLAERAGSLLEPSGDVQPRFFRFPFLREGDTPEKLEAMRGYLRESGQRNLPATIDNQDWTFEGPWVEARRDGDQKALQVLKQDYLASLRLSVKHHERTGDDLFGRKLPQVLLLHANEIGSAAWNDLFSWLEAAKHRFASADEVLADPAFQQPHAYVGPYGLGLWDRLLSERRVKEATDAAASLLAKQVAAWNAGNLEEFCSVYTDDALFISPSGVTRGRRAVLERYRARYPDIDAMGKLALDIIETRPMSGVELSELGDAAPSRVHGVTVAARWTLTYPGKPPTTGHTMLVLRPRSGRWEIAQDASM